MSLKMGSNNAKQDLGRIEDGTFPGRVSQIIDLGQQHDTFFSNGANKKLYYEVDADGKNVKGSDNFSVKVTEDTGHPVVVHKVYINYEFPTERIDVGGVDRPRWQGKEYNVTGTGALAKLVEALSPGSTDIGAILNQPCSISIGSTSGGKAKITSVSAPMKGLVVGELENPATVFDFDEPDMAAWGVIPLWMKENIKGAVDYPGSKLSQLVDTPAEAPAKARAAAAVVGEDDIPY